ncbi:MAG: serine/threonine-protein kinase [Cellulomonas sp.]
MDPTQPIGNAALGNAELGNGSARVAGRYELGARLGAGAMADVYQARDTLLGRDVALKVFRDPSTESTFDARQQAEIGLLARLNHPGLVTIFDVGSGRFDGAVRSFLVVELVRGPSLADRLAGGPLAPTQAALVGAQVAEALAYIHGCGVVHRDVKPANILLPGDARAAATQPWAKLTDFGIARLVDEARLTSTGTLLGTPRYLSPEQATGVVPGPPTDVYALGLVLIECLTGERVYPGTVLESVAARLDHDPIVPTSLGQAWHSLLTRMTTRDPATRPTSLEASAALRDLVTVPDPTRAMAAIATPQAAVAARRGAGDATQLMVGDPTATSILPAAAVRSPTDATAILPSSFSPAPTATGDDGGRPSLAAEPRGGRRALRRFGRWGLAALVTVAVVVGLAIALAIGRPGATPDPGPSYPAVPGSLGDHLETLQRSVSP